MRRFRVEFVRETRLEAAAVLQAYRSLIAGESSPDDVLRHLHVAARQGVSPRAMRLLGEVV